MPNIPQIKIGNTTYDLKDKQANATIDCSGLMVAPEWVIGSIDSDGTDKVSANRLRTKYIEIKDNLYINVKSGYQYEIDYYNLNGGISFIGVDGWNSGFKYVFHSNSNTTHCRVLLKKEAGGAISIDECSNITIGYNIVANEINRMVDAKYQYIYKNGDVGQIRPDNETAKIRIIPIIEGHIYDVFVHGGNRRLFALSNNAYPVIGETVNFAETFSSNMDQDKIFRFTNSGNYKYLYAYYQYGEYSGDPFTIDIHDITDLNINIVNTFKGWYFTETTQLAVRGADAEMCVAPIQPNSDYVVSVTGGNRRRIGLSNSPYPVENESVNKIYSTSTTNDSSFRFNSGDYHFCYVYYHTTDAEQLKPGSVIVNKVTDADAKDTVSEIFSSSVQASQGENVGDDIRLMTYNVYNYQTGDYGSKAGMPDDKVLNFRKFLGKVNADFLCLQECPQYIDTSSSKACHEYLYLPQYPYAFNSNNWTNANVVLSKKQGAGSSGRVKYTDGGSSGISIQYATFQYGQKTLLVCSSHVSWRPTDYAADSAEAIALRLSNYQDLFAWVRGTKTLKNLSNVDTSAPAHTHCIIGMDSNSLTSTDKSNIASLAVSVQDKKFVLGNGGRFGWFYTCDIGESSVCSLDNIVVSDNIIINNIEALSSAYGDLYSDHVPVVADLTLL